MNTNDRAPDPHLVDDTEPPQVISTTDVTAEAGTADQQTTTEEQHQPEA